MLKLNQGDTAEEEGNSYRGRECKKMGGGVDKNFHPTTQNIFTTPPPKYFGTLSLIVLLPHYPKTLPCHHPLKFVVTHIFVILTLKNIFNHTPKLLAIPPENILICHPSQIWKQIP